MKRYTAVLITAISMAFLTGALGGEALALDCLGGGGALVGTECRITTPVTGPCPYSLTLLAGQDLLVTSTGSISCSDPALPLPSSASSITINVPGGNMTMESGSEITAENKNGGGNGANIAITVSGDFVMKGTGTPASPTATNCAGVAGACISSSDVDGGGGKAGDVTITVGNYPNSPPVGVFTMEPGSAVLANSTSGSAGEIIVTSGLQMDIDGLVRSFGGIGGTGSGQPRGGGPITIKTGCELVITPDGVVSSEGFDPGADLVHLEGCEVEINGLVQSIARGSGGHVLPVNPPNRCNDDPVAHPQGDASGFTACVEIWGKNVTINSIAPNQGEVNANGVRAPMRAWIDVIADVNVTINNDLVGDYSVHANSATATNSNSFGGVITIKALTGTFAATGEAVQANGTGIGSDGGVVTIQASGDVGLTDSSVEARGPNGSNTRGGTIGARSFNGAVTGTNGNGELDASGGGSGGVAGSVTLAACTINPLVSYTGTVTPAPPIISPAFPACGGAPTPPAAFGLLFDCTDPACGPGGPCIKRGTKFKDIDGDGAPREAGEPGLPGWKIRAYTFPANAFTAEATTAADGTYEFPNLTCGTYTFCEVLQPGWTQTFPGAVGGDVVSCAAIIDPVGLGPLGYRETLVAGQPSEGNDFGNQAPPAECKEDPHAVCTIKVPDDYPTIGEAYAHAVDNDVICVFTNTIENAVLNGNKTLKITQCTLARVTAADSTKCVIDITTTGHLTIVGLDTVGGSTGWCVETGGHTLKSIRASGASDYGVKVFSSSAGNEVGWNSISGNGFGLANCDGAGMLIEGTSNELRGGTVASNFGDGVRITGNTNTLRGATVVSNTCQGVTVPGTGNIINSNKASKNGTGLPPDQSSGFCVKGASNTLLGNGSNVGSSGGSSENVGYEYCFVGSTSVSSNKIDGVTFTPSGPGCYESNGQVPAPVTCDP